MTSDLPRLRKVPRKTGCICRVQQLIDDVDGIGSTLSCVRWTVTLVGIRSDLGLTLSCLTPGFAPCFPRTLRDFQVGANRSIQCSVSIACQPEKVRTRICATGLGYTTSCPSLRHSLTIA
ncbi:hypothetical protein FIBSPDRAFT_528013 [Athelia psychrophila]|uniref:Uncharacterized protein n=1 Tax=Athelia psychrophila TaxID=1759441 RepID=A0A167TJ42_9AGAM|nr:hypothetical protein FIBSPDRAFT_528013 [Fibularhizoctonia sp. CBS 109695]